MSRVFKIFYLSVLCSTFLFSSSYIQAHSQSKAKQAKSTDSKTKNQATKSVGEQTFGSHCASCHANGGNVVRREKPLAGSKHLSNFITFKDYLDKPIGTMPHYENLIKNDKTLRKLYDYVKTLSDSKVVGS